MAQKRGKTKRKSTNSRSKSRKNKGINIGKLSIGLLVVVALGYAALAIWEGKIDTGFLKPETEQETDTPESQPEDRPEAEIKPNLEGYDLYFTKAFDFAWPAYTTDQMVVERIYFTLSYNEKHEQADWVAYQLHADSLRLPKHERKDNFRADTRVKTKSASLADYRGSGYDRGHLAAAADFSYSEFALSQSFFMSNMSPQVPGFNRGIWKKLEEQVRDWAMEHEHLYVVTGPVLNKDFETIGNNAVSVPEQYYKIVLDIDKPGIKAIAFLMNNESSSQPLESFVVTIDQVEQLTGLDFFPSISDELEDILEGQKFTEDWF